MARGKRNSTNVTASFARVLNEYVSQAEAKGKTQDEIARGIGISGSQLYDYRNDLKTPTIDTLDRICSFFDIPADFMLTGVRPENRKIADYTGLSDDAIEKLHDLKASSAPGSETKRRMISRLLADDDFWRDVIDRAEEAGRISKGKPLRRALENAFDEPQARQAISIVQGLNENGYGAHVLLDGETAQKLLLRQAGDDLIALLQKILSQDK